MVINNYTLASGKAIQVTVRNEYGFNAFVNLTYYVKDYLADSSYVYNSVDFYRRMQFYAFTRKDDYSINKIYDMSYLDSVLLPVSDSPYYIWIQNNQTTQFNFTVLASNSFTFLYSSALALFSVLVLFY